MPSLELVGGSLRVSYPASYQAQRPRPGAAGRPGATGAAEGVTAALLHAFAGQGLELVAPVDLAPASPAAPPGSRPRQPSRPGKVRIALDLPPDTDAVLLLEQDGFFSWQLPTGHEPAPAGSPPPGAGSPRASAPPGGRAAAPTGDGAAAPAGGGPAGQTVLFEVDVRPYAPARPNASARPVLGPFGDYVIGQVRTYVLKFAGRFIPGALMSLLERDLHPGLVLMTGDDVRHWPLVDNLTQVPLPTDRPAKILLFVPGTFSTTVGSFGVLTATAEGQTFLAAAAGSYDAILGFDHRTLSRDPLENALDLHDRLAARDLTYPPAIDVVSYSRGGLVARSLIEYVLPSSALGADLGTVAFVGATNAGTALAEPDNWNAFIDLYTNLAAATVRSTGAAPAALILDGLVAGLGAFVKFLVLAAITDRGIPGLAAMEPDGPFITDINGTQPGQPVAGTPWYVVSSDFEVTLIDDTQQPPVLPPELVAKLADGLADQLMGVQNDLIVNTASMGAIDLPSGGGFVKDSLSFGTNGVVHHLNYFSQPKVCDALRTWLT